MEITRIMTNYAQKSPRTLFGMSLVDYMLSLGMEPGKNVIAVDFTHIVTQKIPIRCASCHSSLHLW